MNFEAMSHRARRRPCIDVPPVGPQAVAVAEGVRDQSLAAGFQLFPQASPSRLSIEVGAETIGSAIAGLKRRQLNQPRLPALEKVPRDQSSLVLEREGVDLPWLGDSATTALALTAPPVGLPGAAVLAHTQVKEFDRPQPKLRQQADRIAPAKPSRVVGHGRDQPQDLGIADRIAPTLAFATGGFSADMVREI